MRSSTKNTENCGTILIVDDDPAVLILIQTMLIGAHYRVLPAGSGEDAIRLAGQKHLRIDLALLDVRMPGVRPTELADEILSLRRNIPILFMSGFVDDEIVRIRLLKAYAGFLPKPFKRDCLLRAVRQAMETPKSSDCAAAGYLAP